MCYRFDADIWMQNIGHHLNDCFIPKVVPWPKAQVAKKVIGPISRKMHSSS